MIEVILYAEETKQGVPEEPHIVHRGEVSTWSKTPTQADLLRWYWRDREAYITSEPGQGWAVAALGTHYKDLHPSPATWIFV